jgi:hypothetical protein
VGTGVAGFFDSHHSDCEFIRCNAFLSEIAFLTWLRNKFKLLDTARARRRGSPPGRAANQPDEKKKKTGVTAFGGRHQWKGD